MKKYPNTEIFLHIDDEKPVCVLETNDLRAGVTCINIVKEYGLKHLIRLTEKDIVYVTFRCSNMSILMSVILELKKDYIVTIY